MFETIRYIVAAVLMLCGVVSAGISILGVFRFHFVMNRMHCAAILDTVSMAGIFGGLMVATGSMSYIPKLLAALVDQNSGYAILRFPFSQAPALFSY